MTGIILYLAIFSFAGIFFSMLFNLRKLEIQNKNLRKELLESEWNKIKF
jgi:hypothetical protein